MKTSDAIKHFRTQQKLATALGLAQSSVAEWGEYPPRLRQLQIAALTAGALEAEPGILPTASANVDQAQAA
jgi:hypothetical protein